MKIISGLIIILSSISIHINEQYSDIQKIDSSINECMQNKIRTQDLLDCINTADSLMDILLNESYKQLILQLKPEDKENLKKSQREWLVFYNLEVNFINKAFRTYANFSKYETGMEQNIDNSYKIYNLKKDRVGLLIDYIKITKPD